MVVSILSCPAYIATSWIAIPLFSNVVIAVLRNLCWCTFSTPDSASIFLSITRIPFGSKRLPNLPMNRAGLLSVLMFKYLRKHILLTSLRYTTLSFLPFPKTRHSPNSICTSSGNKTIFCDLKILVIHLANSCTFSTEFN